MRTYFMSYHVITELKQVENLLMAHLNLLIRCALLIIRCQLSYRSQVRWHKNIDIN